jgi:hypothetical protein
VIEFERVRRRERQADSEPEVTTVASKPRLQVGSVDDPAERAADVAADQALAVLRAGDTAYRSASVSTTRIRRSAVVGAEGGPVDAGLDDRIQRARRSSGSPLDAGTRASMEHALGADLGGVRVHQGTESADLNRAISAEAFTVGRDVFFRDGTPDLGTDAGRHLMAHELAHTVQHGGGTASRRVRRMPSAATIKADSGKKSKTGTKVFGKRFGATNSYNAVLAAVDDYRNFLSTTPIPGNQVLQQQQWPSFAFRLNAIVAAAETYLAKDDTDPGVASICQDLIEMAPWELRAAKDIGAKHLAKPPMSALGGQKKWILEMPRDARTYQLQAPDLQRGKVTPVASGATDKGQNKSVAKVTNASGATGFFALDDESKKYESDDEFGGAKMVLERYGPLDEDLKLGNRSIAMSRLDQLLGAGVIARTEQALKGDKLGTFMWEAQGLSARDAAKNDLSGDPNLPRLLSRLQLIDTIAGQVDRHPGNYYVQTDRNGTVTGITGIDLDMSWVGNPKAGAKIGFDVQHGSIDQREKWKGQAFDHFPGFSRFVDKELATAIIALSPLDLRAILVDLLTPDMIAAAIERLVVLQALLIQLRDNGQLLDPDQWAQHVRAKVVDENQSYYSRDVGGKDRKGAT